jgi:glycosyltransferase involved in cell wall biosynthesis
MAAIGPEAVARFFRLGDWLSRKEPVRRMVVASLVGLSRLPVAWNREPLAVVQALTKRAGLLRGKYGVYQKLVAPTDFLYEMYAGNGFPVAKLIKINFGINWKVVEHFRSQRKYDPSRPLRFGYIGQIAAHKGVDMLIEAFRRANCLGRHELKIYGSLELGTPYFEELSEAIKGDASIVFAGTFPQNELGRRLSELDILVIPSRWYENSPLVLLYALATRTPTIVSDVKGMTEFVNDGVNGLTFTRGDLDSLAAALQRIIDNPEMIEEFSRQADYAKTVTDHVDEIATLYQDIAT